MCKKILKNVREYFSRLSSTSVSYIRSAAVVFCILVVKFAFSDGSFDSFLWRLGHPLYGLSEFFNGDDVFIY